VTIWIYGNNWSWQTDRTTPPVSVALLLLDKNQQVHTLDLARVVWKEWWLVHKVLPAQLRELGPLQTAGLQITGGSNAEDRELYLEDLVFYQETSGRWCFNPGRGAASIRSRASRRAPTRAGAAAFSHAPADDLAGQPCATVSTRVEQAGDAWQFVYEDADVRLEYELSAGAGFWNPAGVRLGGSEVARAMVGAGPKFVSEPTDVQMVSVQRVGTSCTAAGKPGWTARRWRSIRP